MPHSARILIVDDEPKICSFVGRALAAAGYYTEFAASGSAGLAAAINGDYHLVILDLVMPDLDGRQVLARLLRANPGQAVIVLSCVADVAAKVDCLERGAQDYLTKPFSLAELLARVRVRLRGEAHPVALEAAVPAPVVPAQRDASPDAATGGSGTAGELIRAGGVILDVGRMAADIGEGPVPLTRLEFLLLRELAEHAGQSVPKVKLLSTVWGYDFDPGSNVVDVCVRRVRCKLGSGLIKTVRGEGYQLAAR